MGGASDLYPACAQKSQNLTRLNDAPLFSEPQMSTSKLKFDADDIEKAAQDDWANASVSYSDAPLTEVSTDLVFVFSALLASRTST